MVVIDIANPGNTLELAARIDAALVETLAEAACETGFNQALSYIVSWALSSFSGQ